MRVSYALLVQMAAEGDLNARFIKEKWDHELDYPAPGKKIECNVSESGEVSLFIARNKQTVPGTPAARLQQNAREQAITQPEMRVVPKGGSLPGAGSKTPSRPTLRKETWQWMAVQRPDLNTLTPELPIPHKALPYPTQYSGVCSEDE